MRLETRAVHAGRSADPSTGAVVPPIHLATTFERAAGGQYPLGYVYSRSGNPNRAALEACLADLEGGTAAVAFSSGSAATAAVFGALGPGDHVIAPTDVYHGTARLLREHFARWGLTVTFADLTEPGLLAAAIRPTTRLVWIETPSNPLLKVTDVARAAELAHAAGARVCVDNTWASPILQRPLDLGADLSLHATTKYLGGHGDVTGGAVVAREEDGFLLGLQEIQAGGGAVPSPFDCWLVLRGIRTLPYRMRAHSEHARRVAGFLAEHAAVLRVHYPGLATHSGHAVAADPDEKATAAVPPSMSARHASSTARFGLPLRL